MFLSKIIAAAPNEDRSPYGDFWFNPVSSFANGGARVTADNSLQLSAVYRAVSIKSTGQAMLPFVMYKERSDGSKQRVTNHPLYKLFTIRPNPFQNKFEWREMMNAFIELRGNAYNQIISDQRGEITALMPMHPDKVKMELLDNGSYRYRYTDRNGIEVILSRGEVWHLRGISTDGLMGLSTIELARRSLSGAVNAEEYGNRFWANDAKPSGGWIESPNKFKDDEERKKFRESIQKAQGGANRGKMMVLEHGMKFHEVGLTNEDAQFLESKKHNITEIARWFGVPPHKLGDLDKATFSNIEQQSLEFIQDCLQPSSVRWEASIEAELLFEDEGIKVEFDLTHLMRGDSAARSAYYNNGINAGWLTRNEARIAENYDRLDGLDEPLRPLNMTTEAAADDLPQDVTGTKDDTTVPVDNNQQASSERAYLLASAAADRIARKEFEMVKALYKKPETDCSAAYEKHAAFIAAVLNISYESATIYTDSQKTAISSSLLEEDFLIMTITKLEKLALEGTL